MSLRISFNNKQIDGAYGGVNQFTSGLENSLRAQGHVVFRTLEPNLDVIVILTPRARVNGITSYPMHEAVQYVKAHPGTVMVLRANTLDEQRGSDLGDNLAMMNAARDVD